MDPAATLPPLPGGALLAAVSGGADSTALMHLLSAAGAAPAVAHFNHKIRGAESDADEAFVRARVAALGLPFFHASADVPAEAARGGESLEMAARRLRHAFLQKTARENGFAAIATGHNADDRLEMFFMRLARGASLRGLCGMDGGGAAQRRAGRVPVIRPLLRCRHAQLCAWLAERGLPWREDSSNAAPEHLRNRVRRLVIPAFYEAFGEGAGAAAARTMDLLRADDDFLSGLAAGADARSAAALAALPEPVFNRAAADFLYALPVEPELITGVTLARLRAMACAPPRGTVRMPVAQGWSVVRSGDSLTAERDGADAPAAPPAFEAVITRGAVFTPPPRSADFALPLTFFVSDGVDAEKIVYRTPARGERISPAGAGFTRKISDVLTDLKVPRARRGAVIVAAEPGGALLALPGYATDERARVRPGGGATRIDLRAAVIDNHGTAVHN